MSDGPYRSLPMRLGWKRVARRADNLAFTTVEITGAILVALKQDWHAEVLSPFFYALCKLFRDQETTLFKDQLGPQLDTLRCIAGSGIGRVVLDEAIRASESGATGMDALKAATSNALVDRAARGARQVEEHVFRESTAPRSHYVRGRIEQAIENRGINSLAGQLLGLSTRSSARLPLRQQGLDDGVRF